MTALHDLLQRHVDEGVIPGGVALVGRGHEVEVVAIGDHDVEGSAPMTRDTIFRVASITKMVTAATVMMLVEDGLLGLGDPVREWPPELASPTLMRDFWTFAAGA